MFAGMSDGGYYRFIGKKVDGKVVWRVNETYGPNGTVYEFCSIDELTFIEFQG